MTIYDPQRAKVFGENLTADEYGGITAELPLDPEAVLGQYQIQISAIGGADPRDVTRISGGSTFRVEEYKKPEFEVTVDAPTEPVMLGEDVTAKVTAKYYFGSPVTDATVKLKVLRSEYDATWYPNRPWDWCYGPGYWWFVYDYTWYPGWEKWHGCVMPPPWWFPRDRDPPEVVIEQEVPIGPDGTASVTIDTSVAKALFGNHDHKYEITAEVRDQSRRTIVGSGTVLVAREPFQVYTWLDRGYYRTGDRIGANFQAQTLDKQPVTGEGELTLYRITYEDGKTEPTETPVSTWKLDTDEQGEASQAIRAAETGQYRLNYALTDKAGHTIEGGYIFTIIGGDETAGDFRFNALELIPDQETYQPGETVKLQVNVNQPDATVLVFVKPTSGVYLPPQVVHVPGRTTVVEIPVTTRDMPNFFVEAVTVAGAEAYHEVRDIIVPPEKRILNVAVEPSQETYQPGEPATVDLIVTGPDGKPLVGSAVVSIYDKSVEYISGGSNIDDIREFFWKWRRNHNPVKQDTLDRGSTNLTRPGDIAMQYLGVFGNMVAIEGLASRDKMDGPLGKSRGLGDRAVRRSGAMAYTFGGGGGFGGAPPGPPMMAAPMMEAAAAPMADGLADNFSGGVGGDAGGGAAMVEPTVRTNFADTALWVGRIETDKDGRATVKLDMPENLTTWKIGVWTMAPGTKVGHGTAEVVTRKDLLIRMQTPRFLVETDEVVLTANVHNYLDKEKSVRVEIELPAGHLSSSDPATRTVTIPAGGEARIDWRTTALAEGDAEIVMKALTDEVSDAMAMTVPVTVRGILQTESWAGTVRPDQPAASVTIDVPADRRVDQTVLEVRFSPTLAGAMVDALPYLADYPYGCTEQTLNRFLPAVMTRKTLQRVGIDLAAVGRTRTNLNAQEIGDPAIRAEGWKRFDRNPVFEPAELDQMIDAGIERLANMQVSDGGWGWFSGTGERSYPHTTAIVVHGLIAAREADVAVPERMLSRGVSWLEDYAAEQVRLLDNHKVGEKPNKAAPSEIDALICFVLTEAGKDNGRLRKYCYDQRVPLSVYAKAVLALACHAQGDAERVAMLRRNIEQYLVIDEENETAYLDLPEGTFWWYWYGREIETDAFYLKLLVALEPEGTTAPRLVKYLLNNRKHGTYWTSTRDTAYVVEAFAEYLAATGEARPDMTVTVSLDGDSILTSEITAENLFTFEGTAILVGDEVPAGSHVVKIERLGTGPVYFNAYLTNFTTEKQIPAAGLEIKVTRDYYKLVPSDETVLDATGRGQAVDRKIVKYDRVPLADGDDVVSGDLIEVELTIVSKNDYEYIVFEDYKAAGTEPVTLTSGYNTEGLRSYVQYRDELVSFFCRELPRGTHSVSYRVRAETPGTFTALPTIGTGMYAPELRANAADHALVIEDQPAKE